MENIRATFITTVFNEEKNILILIRSLLSQTFLPKEILIVDGGSTDNTITLIKEFVDKNKLNKIIKLFIKPGNRSYGRNFAIKNSKNEIIVCTDAGCELKKDWFEKICKPLTNNSVDVVAGYYGCKYKTNFQKCLCPYVLVMPDKLNLNTFLPSTRSIAFRKSIWEKVGGFREDLTYNEDYVFARKIAQMGIKIKVEKDAIVYWFPRETIHDSFAMFYRFALGDVQAGIIRPKVVFLFLRYFLGLIILLTYLALNLKYLLYIFLTLIGLYFMCSIIKNYKYVKNKYAYFYLPLIQIVSDVAVILGSISGLTLYIGKWYNSKIKNDKQY